MSEHIEELIEAGEDLYEETVEATSRELEKYGYEDRIRDSARKLIAEFMGNIDGGIGLYLLEKGGIGGLRLFIHREPVSEINPPVDYTGEFDYKKYILRAVGEGEPEPLALSSEDRMLAAAFRQDFRRIPGLSLVRLRTTDTEPRYYRYAEDIYYVMETKSIPEVRTQILSPREQ